MTAAEVTTLRQRLLKAKIRALKLLASSPEVAEELKLSDEQQQEIQRIVAPNLSLLCDESKPLSTREKLSEQLYAELFNVLTLAQQRTFLSGEFEEDLRTKETIQPFQTDSKKAGSWGTQPHRLQPFAPGSETTDSATAPRD
jgi:hypothetical protein